jgi:hypothetical protein
VTHHGSQPIITPLVLSSASKVANVNAIQPCQAQHEYCHYCKRSVSVFLRLNYLHQCSVKPKRANGVAECGP